MTPPWAPLFLALLVLSLPAGAACAPGSAGWRVLPGESCTLRQATLSIPGDLIVEGALHLDGVRLRVASDGNGSRGVHVAPEGFLRIDNGSRVESAGEGQYYRFRVRGRLDLRGSTVVSVWGDLPIYTRPFEGADLSEGTPYVRAVDDPGGVVLEGPGSRIDSSRFEGARTIAVQVRDTSGVEVVNTTIAGGLLGVVLVNATGSRVSGNMVSHSQFQAIALYNSRDNTVEGNTVEDGRMFGLYSNFSRGNTFRGNRVLRTGYGARVGNWSRDTLLEKNVLKDNDWGVSLSKAINVTLASNRVEGSRVVGMGLHRAPNVTVADNALSSNREEVRLSSTEGARLRGNRFRNATPPYILPQPGEFSTLDHQMEDNTADGRPILYLNREEERTLEGLDAAQVFLFSSPNVTLRGGRVSPGGLVAVESRGLRLQGMEVEGTPDGVVLQGSRGVRIEGSRILGGRRGLVVDSSEARVEGSRVRSGSRGVLVSYFRLEMSNSTIEDSPEGGLVVQGISGVRFRNTSPGLLPPLVEASSSLTLAWPVTVDLGPEGTGATVSLRDAAGREVFAGTAGAGGRVVIPEVVDFTDAGGSRTAPGPYALSIAQSSAEIRRATLVVQGPLYLDSGSLSGEERVVVGYAGGLVAEARGVSAAALPPGTRFQHRTSPPPGIEPAGPGMAYLHFEPGLRDAQVKLGERPGAIQTYDGAWKEVAGGAGEVVRLGNLSLLAFPLPVSTDATPRVTPGGAPRYLQSPSPTPRAGEGGWPALAALLAVVLWLRIRRG